MQGYMCVLFACNRICPLGVSVIVIVGCNCGKYKKVMEFNRDGGLFFNSEYKDDYLCTEEMSSAN